MTRVLVVFLTAGFLSGCSMLPGRVQTGGPGGGWGSKTISFKEEPMTLVAVDETLCNVTTEKYRKVKTGDRVWCYWRVRGDGLPGLTPGQATGPNRGFDR